MALLLKNVPSLRNASSGGTGVASPFQLIHVARATAVLPQSTTEMIFRVFGGRVLVHMLYGEVTTVMTSTDPQAKVSSKALDASSAAVGTAVDVASTTTLASKEVGSNATVLGSGAALVVNNAGAGIATLGRIPWVAPQGEIYVTTVANNTTGKMKWDIWYQPLDEGAYVVAQPAGTAII